MCKKKPIYIQLDSTKGGISVNFLYLYYKGELGLNVGVNVVGQGLPLGSLQVLLTILGRGCYRVHMVADALLPFHKLPGSPSAWPGHGPSSVLL